MTEHHPDFEMASELLPMYVLGTCTDLEREFVERVLEVDPRLQSELAKVQLTLTDLAMTTEPDHIAPAVLRDRVLDAAVADTAAATTPRPVASIASHRIRRLLGGTLAVAASVIIVALMLDNRSMSEDLSDARSQLQRAQARAEQADQTRLVTSERDAAAPLVRVATSQALSDVRAVTLIDDGRAVLVVHDMPDPGAGHTWQVWTTHASGAITHVASAASASDEMVVPLGALSPTKITGVIVTHEGAKPPQAPSAGRTMARASFV